MLLVALAALLPVPYVALRPGPTANTLGSEQDTELITIEDRETYPTSGHLQLTTVRVSGGPGSPRMDLLQAIRGWIDPEVAIVPIERVYPPDETASEEVEQRTAEEMQLSQQDATAAALRALDIPVATEVAVGSVVEDAPAEGKLEAGDVIVRVDDVRAVSPEAVGDAVRSKQPGDTVTFVVRRDGDELEVPIVTGPSPDAADVAAVGITPVIAFSYPFTVRIQLEDVGGPSAGLMFALGIYDKLTPGELTGGRFIAGTGEIDADGEVGPIGGIQQKLVAARESGRDGLPHAGGQLRGGGRRRPGRATPRARRDAGRRRPGARPHPLRRGRRPCVQPLTRGRSGGDRYPATMRACAAGIR